MTLSQSDNFLFYSNSTESEGITYYWCYKKKKKIWESQQANDRYISSSDKNICKSF